MLQLALAYGAVGNGGDLWVPQLVDRIETPSGRVVQKFEPRLRRHVVLDPGNLQRVRSALCDVVNVEKGTAWVARDDDLPFEVCGKTGTAQVKKSRKGQLGGWDTDNAHSWFAAYAPAQDPELAVAVLVEHGGLGGHVAAPIVMDILRAYLVKGAGKASSAAPAAVPGTARATAGARDAVRPVASPPAVRVPR